LFGEKKKEKRGGERGKLLEFLMKKGSRPTGKGGGGEGKPPKLIMRGGRGKGKRRN